MHSMNPDFEIPQAWQHDERGVARVTAEPPIPPAEIEERTRARIIPRLNREKILENACESCGAKMAPGEPPHEVVTRVVRPGETVGNSRAGQAAYIEPRHLDGPMLTSTMSIEEWRAHETALEARRVARAAAQAPKKGRLAEMVDQLLPGIQAQTRSLIDAGKKRMGFDSLSAVSEARQFLDASRAPTEAPARLDEKLIGVLDSIMGRLEALEKRLK